MSQLARKQRGSQTVEFASALTLLVVVIVLPLLNLSVIPLRWALANEIVTETSRRLSFCETLSQSIQMMQSNPSLIDRLKKIGGIKVDNLDLYLRITRVNSQDEHIDVESPGTIPQAWLPGGTNGPCTYSIVLKGRMWLFPALAISKASWFPGLISPVPITIRCVRDWGNLGKDPATGNFFLNE